MKELTDQNVNDIMRDCLFSNEEVDGKTEEELKQNAVPVDGLVVKVGFHKGRLEEHATEIEEMLAQLPSAFKEGEGDGWSFWKAALREDGMQWTKSDQRIDELFMLGMGIGKAEYRAPREFWSALPGGMPYYVVLKQRKRGN